MRRRDYLCWIGLLLGLSGIVAGCNPEQEQKIADLTGSLQTLTAPAEKNPRLNFYTGDGISEEVGVYLKPGEFVVQVLAGTYLLEYTTPSGTFYIAFTVRATSLLHVGLQNTEQVQEALLYPGRIIPGSQAVYETQTVSVFAWPAGTVHWSKVFQFASQ